jgi:rhodanese-related sulfurtransferase
MFGWIPTSMCFPLPDIEAGGVPPGVPLNSNILMVCRTGRRSEKAILVLSQKGFSNFTNLVGGTQKWVRFLLLVVSFERTGIEKL